MMENQPAAAPNMLASSSSRSSIHSWQFPVRSKQESASHAAESDLAVITSELRKGRREAASHMVMDGVSWGGRRGLPKLFGWVNGTGMSSIVSDPNETPRTYPKDKRLNDALSNTSDSE